jgi:hypothetical protein
MLNWSDKLLDRVETALDHAGWLGKTADTLLSRFMPHDTAQAGCIQCHCEDCLNWKRRWCYYDGIGCIYDGGDCSPPGPC